MLQIMPNYLLILSSELSLQFSLSLFLFLFKTFGCVLDKRLDSDTSSEISSVSKGLNLTSSHSFSLIMDIESLSIL